MTTCPNCGEIVMEGDPYCSHCGTTLRWNYDDGVEDNRSKLMEYLELAKNCYLGEDYLGAFVFVVASSYEYDSMNAYEKSMLGTNPMEWEWVADTICWAFNSHDRDRILDVAIMIREHGVDMMICNDCNLLYPNDQIKCDRCGKPLTEA